MINYLKHHQLLDSTKITTRWLRVATLLLLQAHLLQTLIGMWIKNLKSNHLQVFQLHKLRVLPPGKYVLHPNIFIENQVFNRNQVELPKIAAQENLKTKKMMKASLKLNQ